MRIGFNARLLIKNRMEGIGWHAYEIISRLIALNPQHTFYLFYDRVSDILIPAGDNVVVISLNPPSRHPLLIWAWCEYSLRKACIDQKIALFYSPEVLMPAKLNIPIMITVHDLSPLVLPDSISWSHRFFYRFIINRNLKLADRILTVSEFSKKEIILRCDIPDQKIEVIYNGARKIFKPQTENEKNRIRQVYTQGHPYFIAIGSIHARKNIDKIIAGFERFKMKYDLPIKLVLAGRFMGLSKPSRMAIDKSFYRDDIISTGYVEEEILSKLLGSADALINLSEYEGFGMPLVEAFAAGVPVVASDKSCYPEIGGNAALLVDPSQPEEIAVALRQAQFDRRRLIDLGSMELKRFDWDVSASKISTWINTFQ